MRKPYVVLVDPVSGRGAAYNGQHRLMADEASGKLVRFALERHTLSAPWDEKKDAARPRQRPSWAAPSLEGCTLYWLRDGKSTAQHLRETPNR